MAAEDEEIYYHNIINGIIAFKLAGTVVRSE